MRELSVFLAMLLAGASTALAGITVTSYKTLARVNGYAPVSQTEFFEEQTFDNASPAAASVSGDWMGTNAGGSTSTWHFVGSAQASTATSFDQVSMRVTASAAFAYNVETTAAFVDPGGVNTFRPGAAANYDAFFAVDAPTDFVVSGALNQWSQVRPSTSSGVTVFNYVNITPAPLAIGASATIPAGSYRILMATGVGAPNFPDGVNTYSRSGGFDNVVFAGQVPEPNLLFIAIFVAGAALPRRDRCARAT